MTIRDLTGALARFAARARPRLERCPSCQAFMRHEYEHGVLVARSCPCGYRVETGDWSALLRAARLLREAQSIVAQARDTRRRATAVRTERTRLRTLRGSSTAPTS